MSKQTAVEWFWNQLPDILLFSLDTETAFKLLEAKEQALAMEREQIEKAYDAGHDDGHDEANGDGSYYDTKEDYYERTYGKEAGHDA